MLRWIKLYSYFVLAVMLALTTYASLHENVFEGYKTVAREPWGLATLADAYFGFITFYLWIFYKETSTFARLTWLAILMFFGNFAIAAYLLIQLKRLPPGGTVQDYLTQRAR